MEIDIDVSRPRAPFVLRFLAKTVDWAIAVSLFVCAKKFLDSVLNYVLMQVVSPKWLVFVADFRHGECYFSSYFNYWILNLSFLVFISYHLVSSSPDPKKTWGETLFGV